MELVTDILAGKTRAVARAVSIVENNSHDKEALIDALHDYTGHAAVWGITGPPGAGKSTLADCLIQKERDAGKKVAVIAVDPSSPFTGGALLGDRLRMQTHAVDPGVFIRSMASRGHLGGISAGTLDAVKIFDAAGFDTIIVETIGVGQTEIEIIELSDIVMLVLVPGMGDEIQAMKAGIMEIGDVYVVNKSDKDGAQRLKAEIEYVLMLKEQTNGDPSPGILMTSSRDNTGIDELHIHLTQLYHERTRNGMLSVRRKKRIKKEMDDIFNRKVQDLIEKELSLSANSSTWIEKVYRKEIKLYSFINNTLAEFERSNKK